MHINRFMRSHARRHEAVVYDFLARIYGSMAAKKHITGHSLPNEDSMPVQRPSITRGLGPVCGVRWNVGNCPPCLPGYANRTWSGTEGR